MFKLAVIAALVATSMAQSTTMASRMSSTPAGSGAFNAINLGAAATCLSDGEAAGVLINAGLVSQEDIVDIIEIDGELVVLLDTTRVDPDGIQTIVMSINNGAIDGGCAGTLNAAADIGDQSDYDTGSLAKINFCTTGTNPARRGKSSKSIKSSKGDGSSSVVCVEIIAPRVDKSKKSKKSKSETSKKMKKMKGDKKKSKKKSKKNKSPTTMYQQNGGVLGSTSRKTAFAVGAVAVVGVGLAFIVAGIRRKRTGFVEIKNAEELESSREIDAKETSPLLI